MAANDSDCLVPLVEALERTPKPPPGWTEQYAPEGDLRWAWEACRDGLLLARLASYVGRSDECAAAGAGAVLWAVRLVSTVDDTARRAAATLEAWMDGQQRAASLEEAVLELATWSDGAELDYATRKAVEAVCDALSDVAECAMNRVSSRDTLVQIFEAIILAAGLLEWDEMCAEAALCEAAPWPNPEYDAMVERREAAEEAAHHALADIVRAHIACPSLNGRFQ